MQSRYIYQGQIRLAGTLGSDGLVYQRFGYLTKSHVPDFMIMKDETYRFITDHLGSIRLVVRIKDGAVVQEMMHDEFGKVLKNTAPGLQPFGFAGGLYDHNTNLVQFGARWYDPEIGRWISKDPIKFNGGNNFYEYAANDPINLIDVNGLSPMRISNEGAGHAAGGGGGGGGGGAIILPAIGRILEWLSQSLPIKGPKGGSLVIPGKDGDKKQERTYDNEGYPVKDIDWGHDHGIGKPHVHDWEPGSTDHTGRGQGRKPEPGECP